MQGVKKGMQRCDDLSQGCQKWTFCAFNWKPSFQHISRHPEAAVILKEVYLPRCHQSCFHSCLTQSLALAQVFAQYSKNQVTQLTEPSTERKVLEGWRMKKMLGLTTQFPNPLHITDLSLCKRWVWKQKQTVNWKAGNTSLKLLTENMPLRFC